MTKLKLLVLPVVAALLFVGSTSAQESAPKDLPELLTDEQVVEITKNIDKAVFDVTGRGTKDVLGISPASTSPYNGACYLRSGGVQSCHDNIRYSDCARAAQACGCTFSFALGKKC